MKANNIFQHSHHSLLWTRAAHTSERQRQRQRRRQRQRLAKGTMMHMTRWAASGGSEMRLRSKLGRSMDLWSGEQSEGEAGLRQDGRRVALSPSGVRTQIGSFVAPLGGRNCRLGRRWRRHRRCGGQREQSGPLWRNNSQAEQRRHYNNQFSRLARGARARPKGEAKGWERRHAFAQGLAGRRVGVRKQNQTSELAPVCGPKFVCFAPPPRRGPVRARAAAHGPVACPQHATPAR